MNDTDNNEKAPLSVFIIALNEADRIHYTIESVIRWVDEVIVVDSGSTDQTVAISERLGARVIFNEWKGYGPQKRFGESVCRNDWLLNMDADEELPLNLQHEINTLFANEKIREFDCFKVSRFDQFPHEQKPAIWAHNHPQLRLYRKDKACYKNSIVHDSLVPDPDARIGVLKNPMAHRSHRSIASQVTKMNSYSDMQVLDLAERGRYLPAWRLLTEFPLAFLKGFFVRRYGLYGLWGFVLSLNYAFSRFLRVAKSYERNLLDKAQGRKTDE